MTDYWPPRHRAWPGVHAWWPDRAVDFWRDLQDVPGARVMPSQDSARTRPPNDTTEDD
jgi:hypothetical protein